MRFLFVIGFLSLFSTTGFATSALAFQTEIDPSRCTSANTEYLTRPIDPDKSDAGQFSMAYHLLPGKDPKAPTVLFFTGGPGWDSGIFHVDSIRQELGLSDLYSVLLLDPRGTGCTQAAPAATPDRYYRSSNVAKDGLALLNRLKIENYVVVGRSYGTVPATILASLSKAQGVAEPKALVLDGTLARPYAVGEYVENQDRLFQKALTRLPKSAQAQFHALPLPLGFSPEVWATFLHEQNLADKYDLSKKLKELEQLRKDLEETRKEVESMERMTPPRIYMVVGCRELGFTPLMLTLKKAHLVEVEKEPRQCPPNTLLSEPYDSKDWPVSRPIIYLQGSEDSRTPVDLARHHLTSQSGTNRLWIEAPGIGHGVLKRGVCPQLMNQLLSRRDPTKLTALDSGCGKNVTFTWQAPQ
jgi:pimeloyl-ACP methyl ester carboxylesterase